MEDAHSLHLALPPASAEDTSVNEKPEKSGSDAPEQPQGSSFTNQSADGPAFFGVFDGHGGSAVARFTGTTIHSRLAALDAYSEFGSMQDADKILNAVCEIHQRPESTKRH
jgi:protein phosphatase 2C family protein 2/3